MKKLILALTTILTLVSTGCRKNSSFEDNPDYIQAFVINEFVKEKVLNSNLTAVEKDRFTDDEGQLFARYCLDGKDLPANRSFILQCPYGGFAAAYKLNLKTDSDGRLCRLSSNGTLIQEPLIVTVDASPGAKSKVFLFCTDPQTPLINSIALSPQPIIAKSKSGGQVQLSKVEKGGNIVYLEGKGFTPDEVISIISSSNEVSYSTTIQIDFKGEFTAFLNPYYKSDAIHQQLSGNASIKVFRGAEVLSLHYQWTKKVWSQKERDEFAFFNEHGIILLSPGGFLDSLGNSELLD